MNYSSNCSLVDEHFHQVTGIVVMLKEVRMMVKSHNNKITSTFIVLYKQG